MIRFVCSCWLLLWLTLGVGFACEPPVRIETETGEPEVSHPLIRVAPDDPLSQLPAEHFAATEKLLDHLIRRYVPDKHVDSSKWGQTKRMYAGVKLSADQGRIRTKRRYRDVNHGRWRWVEVALSQLNQQHPFNVSTRILQWDAAEQQIRVSITAEADLELFARQARYNLGVRLYSVHLEATASVQLQAELTIGMGLDYSRFPPAVTIDPTIDAAKLQIVAFQLQRLSHLHGDPTAVLSDGLEYWLRNEWLPKQNAKLPERLNAKLNRRTELLTFSLSDWLKQRLPEATPQR